jgi:hypothetical protein
MSADVIPFPLAPSADQWLLRRSKEAFLAILQAKSLDAAQDVASQALAELDGEVPV